MLSFEKSPEQLFTDNFVSEMVSYQAEICQ